MNHLPPTDECPDSRPAPARLWLRRALDSLSNLVFPTRCIGCSQPGALLCDACQRSLDYLPAGICHSCGRTLKRANAGICPRCAHQMPSLTNCFAVAYSTGALRTAIHRLKYSDQSHLAEPLSALLADWWRNHPLPADLLVPIPLHPPPGTRARLQSSRAARPPTWAGHRAAGRRGEPETCARHPAPGGTGQHRAAKERVWRVFSARAARWQASACCYSTMSRLQAPTLEAAAYAVRRAGAPAVWGVTVARAGPRVAAGSDT